MRSIALTRGLVALVDDGDYDRVNQFKWNARPTSSPRRWYAARGVRTNGRSTTLYMHRFILGADGSEPVDHKDGDGLNNTRGNLRKCTPSQNIQNSRDLALPRSGFRGVAKGRKNFRAEITVSGVRVHLGMFGTPEDAARARDRAALEHWGEFAVLNFPEGSQS